MSTCGTVRVQDVWEEVWEYTMVWRLTVRRARIPMFFPRPRNIARLAGYMFKIWQICNSSKLRLLLKIARIMSHIIWNLLWIKLSVLRSVSCFIPYIPYSFVSVFKGLNYRGLLTTCCIPPLTQSARWFTNVSIIVSFILQTHFCLKTFTSAPAEDKTIMKVWKFLCSLRYNLTHSNPTRMSLL